MKNITKRKDGRYQGTFSYNKKRYFFYDKNKKECYRKLNTLKKEILLKEEPKKRTNPKTNFYDFTKMWYEKFKKNNIKNSTAEMYKNCINNHLIKINKELKEITTIDLQNFLNKMKKTRIKEITYNIIKQIFKKAKELELIDKNPAEFLIKGKIERNQRTGLNLKEQALILNNLKMNDKFSKLILFYLLTGARRNEALCLPKQNISGKYVLIEGTKTNNAKRYVKISDSFYKILINEPKEVLFDYESKYLEKKFRKFCKEINLTATLHQLRHTFSTNLYYLGAKDKERQSYLGHSSSVITNDIYTHLDPNISKTDILNLYKDLYPEF